MALSHNPRIVTDGLVLCLDAANPKSYPGSGTTWFDLSGNGNHCTLKNGTSFSSNTMSTDGVDDYIESPRIRGTGDSDNNISWSIWVSPNDSDGNIMSMSRDNPQNSWNMPPISADNQKFTGKIWSNSRLISDTYTQNQWYQLCLIWNFAQSTQFFYVNGELVGLENNISYSSSGSDNFLYFGQSNPGADNQGNFAGSYSHISVYNGRALTEAEIKQNFNALRGRYGI